MLRCWRSAPRRRRRRRPSARRGALPGRRGALQGGRVRRGAGRRIRRVTTSLPLPGFLINVAQCQRRLGDLADGARHLSEVRDGRARFAAGAAGEVDDRGDRRPAREKPAAEQPQQPPPSEPTSETRGGRPALQLAPPGAGRADRGRPPDGRGRAGSARRRPRRTLVVCGARSARWSSAGTVTAVALSTGGTTTIHDGSLATLRR